jgi:mannitol-specific phosphotransferase system IIBC component
MSSTEEEKKGEEEDKQESNEKEEAKEEPKEKDTSDSVERRGEDYEILKEEFPNYDLSFKIIVIGNAGVGKSCLSIQATKKKFENNYLATVGFEFFVFNMKYKNKVLKLQIWDTCGQEIYRSLITSFYKNSSLAIIVYAIDE